MPTAAALRIALTTATVVVCLPGATLGQTRSDLMGGVSIGAGALVTRGATDDPVVALVRPEPGRSPATVAFGFTVGKMVNPRWALLIAASFDGMATDTLTSGDISIGSRRITFDSGRSSGTALMMAAGAERWLTNTWWARGGVGAGFLSRDVFLDDAGLDITLQKGVGIGVLVASGVDLWSGRNGAAGLEVHLSAFVLKGVRVYVPSVRLGVNVY